MIEWRNILENIKILLLGVGYDFFLCYLLLIVLVVNNCDI